MLIASLAIVGLSGCGGHAANDTADGGSMTPNPPGILERFKASKVSKIDVLLMIDNSSSMADKQALLALAVPDLVGRLTHPVCVDRLTFLPLGAVASDGSCAQGEPDFEPVQDIHIGIISSSLGGHGSVGVCDQPDPQKTLSHNDDKGHLVARDATGAAITTMGGKPFLDWNPTMGGYADGAAIEAPFVQMVTGVGQHGCGYEASLESIYRFLIDPDPYDSISIDKTSSPLGVAVLNGTDAVLLGQRADFLRPDSIVVVMMMTDENDCSIIDGGQNFYVVVPPSGSPAKSILSHATTPCKTNPYDACCYNCLENPPGGCPPKELDAECMAGALLKTEDPENLRCFHQKARYGIDFLYPVKRYIDGFASTQIMDRRGRAVKNPLYSDLTCKGATGLCAPERDKSYVFVAGIVGVPWQLIANDPADLRKGYKTAKQLSDDNVWQSILGNPEPFDKRPPVPPTDSHMIESVTPRAALPGPDSPAGADPIHGHEWDTSKDNPPNRDLQFACTFPLAPGSERVCADSTDCDCANPTGGAVADMKSPLCQGSSGYTTTQVRAKAYPGIRQLQVLQGLNDQAIVTSICAANVTDTTRSDFGYRPAISAVMGRLHTALRGRCLPRELPVDPITKQVPCSILEVFDPPPGAVCRCENDPGRTTAPDALLTAEIRAEGSCRCEIRQLSDANDNGAAAICQTQLSPPVSVPAGWCYVDPSQQGPGSCSLVRSCPVNDQRIIRYVNQTSEPRPGSTGFFYCEPSAPGAFSSAGPVCP